jgi:hypothetical protein
MKPDLTRISAPAHEAAIRLFEDQALTISKAGSKVSVQCDNDDDANAIFKWLSDIGDDTEGDPVGWTIVSIGNDGSLLCRKDNGRRARFWFLGRQWR